MNQIRDTDQSPSWRVCRDTAKYGRHKSCAKMIRQELLPGLSRDWAWIESIALKPTNESEFIIFKNFLLILRRDLVHEKEGIGFIIYAEISKCCG